MHSRSNNIKIKIDYKIDEVMEVLFKTLLSRYQIGLKTLMKDSNFMIDCIHLLYYKYHKINFKRMDYI